MLMIQHSETEVSMLFPPIHTQVSHMYEMTISSSLYPSC